MSFDEYIGRTVLVVVTATGATVIVAALVLGASELLRRLRGERRERHSGRVGGE